MYLVIPTATINVLLKWRGWWRVAHLKVIWYLHGREEIQSSVFHMDRSLCRNISPDFLKQWLKMGWFSQAFNRKPPIGYLNGCPIAWYFIQPSSYWMNLSLVNGTKWPGEHRLRKYINRSLRSSQPSLPLHFLGAASFGLQKCLPSQLGACFHLRGAATSSLAHVLRFCSDVAQSLTPLSRSGLGVTHNFLCYEVKANIVWGSLLGQSMEDFFSRCSS